MTLELDDDGYPTEESLNLIKDFSPYKEFDKLFAAIQKIWAYPDYFSGPLKEPPKEVKPLLWNEKENVTWYRLATAGWSGNEDIISALEQNPMVQALCWCMSARGGLHIYQIPNL
jgi:hypothetical protein